MRIPFPPAWTGPPVLRVAIEDGRGKKGGQVKRVGSGLPLGTEEIRSGRSSSLKRRFVEGCAPGSVEEGDTHTCDTFPSLPSRLRTLQADACISRAAATELLPDANMVRQPASTRVS
eukprot:scaffold261_cov336-Pavlova_lutheri.AAC.66